MKILLMYVLLGSITLAFTSSGQQDSVKTKKNEKEQSELQEKPEKDQPDDKQIKERLSDDPQHSNFKGKNKGKDVFIDKDGDGIADTRAGGMSFNKMRKRFRGGNKGGGGDSGQRNGN